MERKDDKERFPTFMYLRADAGSNFTSHKFKEWCSNNKITLSIAGPKHQEQNAFVERAYGTASRMARSMLVKAHLPIAFYHLALQYACKQMRVLPAKGLLDSEGKPTTTYAILHGKKPRIGRFKVFGCPCVLRGMLPIQMDPRQLISSNFRKESVVFLSVSQKIKQVG